MEGFRYRISTSKEAEEHVLIYKKAGNKIALERIVRIIEELKVHPEFGIGKPKKLKNNKGEFWSRRIDDKNRIIYQIDEVDSVVYILRAIGHYDDK